MGLVDVPAAGPEGAGRQLGGPAGRIVGFWPNYHVTYDESQGGAASPSAAGAGGGPGGKPKAKKAAGRKRQPGEGAPSAADS